MLLNTHTVSKYLGRGLLILAAFCLVKFLTLWAATLKGDERTVRFVQERNPLVQNLHAAQSDIDSLLQELEPTEPSLLRTAHPHLANLELPQRSSSQTPSATLIKAGDVKRSVDPDIIAVVKIPSVNVFVPLFKGTSVATLEKGAGLITGTSPFEKTIGNVGIAAHRDSYFRGLKDIELGHEIEVMTKTHDLTYAVTEIEIVDPEDTRVLYPDGKREITLVTCYPFYFVGNAPQRYIVTAELVGSAEIEK